VQGAGAAHAAHDFVEDEQGAVAGAEALDGGEVAGRGGDAAEGGADGWFLLSWCGGGECFASYERETNRQKGAWTKRDSAYQDNGCDGVGAEAGEFGFELGGFAGDKGGVRLEGVEALAVGVAGGDVMEVRGVEERVEGGAAGVV
jgi:hypothetical protein